MAGLFTASTEPRIDEGAQSRASQPRLAKPASELKSDYDAVVIGSGYGGGVAASRLARCGRKVAVLERGREFLPGEFPDRATAAAKEVQVSGASMRMGAPSALFDVRMNEDVHVLMGCGLGGTSLINANVCLTPDPRVFDDRAWPEPIRRDRLLAEGYMRARHMLRPQASDHTFTFEKVRALRLAAQAFGSDVQPVPVHVAHKAGPNAAGVHQQACTQCGDCCGGCNVGAKTTVACTYLADAAAFGAEIFTEMHVLSLAREADGKWRVTLRPGNWQRDSSHSISVTAGIVVLAAGTLGSTEILLRSRNEGLPVSKWLGGRFTSNGDAIAIAYDCDVPVNGIGVGDPPKVQVPAVGQAVNGLMDLRGEPDVRDGIAIVECALPSAFASLLPALLGSGGVLFGDSAGSLCDDLDAMGRATQSLIDGAYRGAVHNTQTFLAVGHDAGNGLMRLENDRIVIEWTNGPRQRVFQRIEAALARAAEATGGIYMRNPASERILGGNLMTVHPLGGCSMGADRNSGVVNHKGQVFDAGNGDDVMAVHTGLYVCDGAVAPCPLGIHPLLTITALAERAMIHLARDHGWEMKRDAAPLRRAAAAPAPAPAAVAAPKRPSWFVGNPPSSTSVGE
jgi:cholesterol oxidase